MCTVTCLVNKTPPYVTTPSFVPLFLVHRAGTSDIFNSQFPLNSLTPMAPIHLLCSEFADHNNTDISA